MRQSPAFQQRWWACILQNCQPRRRRREARQSHAPITDEGEPVTVMGLGEDVTRLSATQGRSWWKGLTLGFHAHLLDGACIARIVRRWVQPVIGLAQRGRMVMGSIFRPRPGTTMTVLPKTARYSLSELAARVTSAGQLALDISLEGLFAVLRVSKRQSSLPWFHACRLSHGGMNGWFRSHRRR